MSHATIKVTRREALQCSLAAGAAAAIPWIVPATVRRGSGALPPLSGLRRVIGIGPALFDLGCMFC